MRNKKTEVKICCIGGGSVQWAQILMRDLALTAQISGELVLYDVNPTAARHNVQRGNAIFNHPQSRTTFRLRVAQTVPDALRGVDFVVMSIQPGPMEMFANDLDIPLKYGIVQTVGDTTGPGGISRALRTVPAYMNYARQVMKYCPNAWVINYTNPMTLCTAALFAAETGIKAFGCCHEVFGTQRRLVDLVKEHWGEKVLHRSEIKLSVNGVNHFTFVPSARWDGRDLYPLIRKHVRQRGFFADRTEESLKRKEAEDVFGCAGLIAYDFYRRFGVLGAAGDRHLAEFVPWYLRSEEALHRWGVVLTPSSYRLRTRPVIRKGARLPASELTYDRIKPSGEEGVQQILALMGAKDLDTNVNLPNRGQIADLPLGAVVETNAQFRRDSLVPVTADPVPAAVNALTRRVVSVQSMTLQAAIERDKELAFQALLNDPLVTIPTDRAWKMFNELLRANRDMVSDLR